MVEINRLITSVREKRPLIHNITNTVVTNFTANGLLSLGASPVMAYAVEEAADMAKNADALVLNIGTLTSPEIEAMILAGKAANEKGIPVVFDPVGVGATPFRTETARQIMSKVEITLVRGNAGEIANLSGVDWEMKGVDSSSEGSNRALAINAARELGTNIVVTGKEDIVTDGKVIYIGRNGHALLTNITGAGCLLSSVVAAFLAVHENKLEAAIGAVSFYGMAAEVAAETANGPGSFQTAFLDALYHLQPATVENGLKIKKDFAKIGRAHV